MRFVFLVLLVSLNFLSNAQDNEYPDYRSKKETFNRIVEKDIRSDLASYSMGGIDESIGKVPLKTVPITSFGANFISFANSNINVTITGASFNPSKHKLGYFDSKYLVKIDNKPYFGDYGKVPRSIIENITVVIDNDTVPIPQTAFSDLYNPIFTVTEGGVQKSNNKVYLSADGKKVYVYMLKQESGGSYEVTWVIQDKKYLKRVVDFGFLK
ncbi:hypothetical protein [Segetibacter koreensis]|uniref:hypothetical protein n=1 Tax=Segetibacter koreensis TaxID=398037 RepID=UPI00035F526B|nr:hypothetical protein [Segetibacter koreensis]